MHGVESKAMPIQGPSKGKCPYENLKLAPTDNGHKVTYYELSSSVGCSMHDHREMDHKEFVFEADNLKGAVSKYEEICKCMKEYTV